ENRYTVADQRALHHPAAASPFSATAAYRAAGVPLEITVPVTRREAQLPYGYVMREFAVVPALAVNVSPRQAIVPLALATKSVRVQVELTNNAPAGSKGQLALKLPSGWKSEPAAIPFTFARPGEKSRHQLIVSIPAIENRDYTIDAVATANGQDFKQGYDVIEKRDLETRYLYHPSTIGVRGVDVKVAPGLRVGYVMGVGDDVPAGIAQLGVQVQMLNQQDLASADLR